MVALNLESSEITTGVMSSWRIRTRTTEASDLSASCPAIRRLRNPAGHPIRLTGPLPNRLTFRLQGRMAMIRRTLRQLLFHLYLLLIFKFMDLSFSQKSCTDRHGKLLYMPWFGVIVNSNYWNPIQSHSYNRSVAIESGMNNDRPPELLTLHDQSISS